MCVRCLKDVSAVVLTSHIVHDASWLVITSIIFILFQFHWSRSQFSTIVLSSSAKTRKHYGNMQVVVVCEEAFCRIVPAWVMQQNDCPKCLSRIRSNQFCWYWLLEQLLFMFDLCVCLVGLVNYTTLKQVYTVHTVQTIMPAIYLSNLIVLCSRLKESWL